MHTLNRNPTPRQLRQFAGAALVVLPLVGWLLVGRPLGDAWQLGDGWLIGSLAVVGGVLVVLSFVTPWIVRPVFIAASVVTYPIGLVVGELLLAVIYFLVFTPVAMVFRLIGRDVLERGFDRSAKTYWRAKESHVDVESYFRQS